MDAAVYPVRVEAELSRWLWLVKWLLAIPHFIVLSFLWLAFGVLTVVAFFGIPTGRLRSPMAKSWRPWGRSSWAGPRRGVLCVQGAGGPDRTRIYAGAVAKEDEHPPQLVAVRGRIGFLRPTTNEVHRQSITRRPQLDPPSYPLLRSCGGILPTKATDTTGPLGVGPTGLLAALGCSTSQRSIPLTCGRRPSTGRAAIDRAIQAKRCLPERLGWRPSAVAPVGQGDGGLRSKKAQ